MKFSVTGVHLTNGANVEVILRYNDTPFPDGWYMKIGAVEVQTGGDILEEQVEVDEDEKPKLDDLIAHVRDLTRRNFDSLPETVLLRRLRLANHIVATCEQLKQSKLPPPPE